MLSHQAKRGKCADWACVCLLTMTLHDRNENIIFHSCLCTVRSFILQSSPECQIWTVHLFPALFPAPYNCNSSVFYVTYRLTIVFLLHSHKLTIFMFFFVRENDLKRLLSITLGACYWQCVVEEQTEFTLLDEVKCRWLRHTRKDRFQELLSNYENVCKLRRSVHLYLAYPF